MTREEYIESIVSQIDDKAVREEFRRELEAHLDDRIAFYTDAGYDYDYALDKAIGRMGETETVGAQMNNLYNTTKVNKAIWIMATIQCVFSVAFSLLVADYFYSTPYVIFNVSFVLFTVTFFLAAKHKNYSALLLISAVSLVSFCIVPLGFDVFIDTDYHERFREIMTKSMFGPAVESITEYIAYKKYGLNGYYEYFPHIRNRLSGFYQACYYIESVFKVAFYPVSSVSGLFYAGTIKRAINGKSKPKTLKKFSKINYFNITCTLINVIIFIIDIFIYIFAVSFKDFV